MDEQALKQRERRRRLRTGGILLLVVLLALLAVFTWMRKDGGGSDSGKAQGKASVEITCAELTAAPALLKKPGLADTLPPDGVILPKTEISIQPGKTTALDVTVQLCAENDIQIEAKKMPGFSGTYVRGIHYLYEKDAGDKSGWMYEINGERPEYAADEVTLKNDDAVRWFFTVNYLKEG